MPICPQLVALLWDEDCFVGQVPLPEELELWPDVIAYQGRAFLHTGAGEYRAATVLFIAAEP